MHLRYSGADVYSYAPDEDEMVEDPKLAEHLAHWRADTHTKAARFPLSRFCNPPFSHHGCLWVCLSVPGWVRPPKGRVATALSGPASRFYLRARVRSACRTQCLVLSASPLSP